MGTGVSTGNFRNTAALEKPPTRELHLAGFHLATLHLWRPNEVLATAFKVVCALLISPSEIF
jgi:hypothetical protein